MKRVRVVSDDVEMPVVHAVVVAEEPCEPVIVHAVVVEMPSGDNGAAVVSLLDARSRRAFGYGRKPADLAAELHDVVRELHEQVRRTDRFDDAALEEVLPLVGRARRLADFSKARCSHDGAHRGPGAALGGLLLVAAATGGFATTH